MNLIQTGLRRSKSSYSVLLILYTALYLQMAVYFYLKTRPQIENLVLTGYTIGLFGFLAGIGGVHFFLTGRYSYEFGNLETIGYTRFQCIFYYFSQFLLTALASYIPSWLLFHVLYYLFSANDLTAMNIIMIHVKTLSATLVFYSLTVYASLWQHSRPEPFLLIKERL